VGDRHLVVTNDAGIGKRAGRYIVGSHTIEYAFTPLRDFHIGVSAGLISHSISGVPGLDDRRQIAFDHVALEFRRRLLDRATSPFGLAIIAEPHFGFTDERSGERANKVAADLTVAVDKELVRDQLYGAINLFYTPEYSRTRSTGEIERESQGGLSVALMQRVAPWIFVGAELRYARAYEGLALNRYAGEAFFLGPILYATHSEKVALSAAWSTQVAGHAVGATGRLDLENFDRHRARLKLVVEF